MEPLNDKAELVLGAKYNVLGNGTLRMQQLQEIYLINTEWSNVFI